MPTGVRFEIVEGVRVLSFDAPVPASAEEIERLDAILGPLPSEYRAFLMRANGISGEIVSAGKWGIHLFLHDVAQVLSDNAADPLTPADRDDWRRDTVLTSSGNLLIGSYIAGGLIVLESRSEGGWDYLDILTDFQSEPLIGVETRHPTLHALLTDLESRGIDE